MTTNTKSAADDAAAATAAAEAAKKTETDAAAEAAKKDAGKKAAKKTSELYFAINEIHQSDKNGDREVVEAGTVFTPAKDDLEQLTTLGALRPANETEIAMYERVNKTITEDLG